MRKKKAFTLVELLVVMAIISMLAALLLPGLERAVELSRRSVCANNLRQMYVFAAQYNDDNDGWLPYAYVVNTGQNNDCMNVISYGWGQAVPGDTTSCNSGWGIFFSGSMQYIAGKINYPSRYQSPMISIPLMTCPSRPDKHALYSVLNSGKWAVRGQYSYRFNGGFRYDRRYYVNAQNLNGSYKRNALTNSESGMRYALFWDTSAYMLSTSYTISKYFAHQDGGNMIDFTGAAAYVPNRIYLTNVSYSWPAGEQGYGFEFFNDKAHDYGIDRAFMQVQ